MPALCWHRTLACLQLVEVNEGNSRSHSMNRASVDGSNDLRPGSNGFRPLDATVVEVGSLPATRPATTSVQLVVLHVLPGPVLALYSPWMHVLVH